MIATEVVKGAISATSVDLARGRRTFDAIVVGAGAAGGVAAMSLTQSGLRVLVLDAGWTRAFHEAVYGKTVASVVPRVADPRWYRVLPPLAISYGRRALKLAGKVRQPVQTRCFAWEMAPESFVDDRHTPYETPADGQFDWFRVRQLGGRMVVPGHGRQYYRLSDTDFAGETAAASPWPVSSGDMDAWYDRVERALGLEGCGNAHPHQPASRLAHVRTPSPAEAELSGLVEQRWPGSAPILGCHAPPLDGLHAAAGTGRLSLRRGAVVRRVNVDSTGRASGVTWYDREDRQEYAAEAPVVFLCASALESTRILMTSRSKYAPEGIGAASGVLGQGLMDHVLVNGEGVGGAIPGEVAELAPGHCVYLPRFDLQSRAHDAAEPARPFGVQLYRTSLGPDRSLFRAVTFGEMTPRPENRVSLNPDRTDAWGAPVLRVECTHDAAEVALAGLQADAIREIADAAGVKLNRLDDRPARPGTAMHECGTARMGSSPKSSVLDPNNQAWDAPGLYVTDAASFPSQGSQNPTLTIMALTMRACAHAARSATKVTSEAASVVAGLLVAAMMFFMPEMTPSQSSEFAESGIEGSQPRRGSEGGKTAHARHAVRRRTGASRTRTPSIHGKPTGTAGTRYGEHDLNAWLALGAARPATLDLPGVRWLRVRLGAVAAAWGRVARDWGLPHGPSPGRA